MEATHTSTARSRRHTRSGVDGLRRAGVGAATVASEGRSIVFDASDDPPTEAALAGDQFLIRGLVPKARKEPGLLVEIDPMVGAQPVDHGLLPVSGEQQRTM